MTRANTQLVMGKPCRHGHSGMRFASGGKCVECRIQYLSKPEVKTHNAKYGAERRAAPTFRQRQAEWDRKASYDITPTEYNFMFAGQLFCCANCLGDKSGGKGWHTDHCHESGAVRGILCNKCNAGIGMLGDTADSLRRAIAYLERFECTTQQNSPTPTPVTDGQSNHWPNIAQAATLYIPLSAGT